MAGTARNRVDISPPLRSNRPVALGGDINRNPPAHIESSSDLDPARLEEIMKSIQELVDHIFVKDPHITVCPQIKLERLALQNALAGNVGYFQYAEVRLSGDRAQAGEFLAVEIHHCVSIRVGVRERFEMALRFGRSAAQFG